MTITINSVYSHKVNSEEGKMYVVHTVTFEKIKKLFPIDSQLKIKNSK